MAAYSSAHAYAQQSAPPLHHLRQVMHPDYALLPHAELSELVDSMYGPGSAERYDEYLEGIFGDIGKAFSSAARDVGRFAAKAAPVVATVGGGALQGAMAGSSLGLPGIIAGAAAGGVGAGLSKYGSGTARSIGGALSGVTNIAGQFSPMGRLGGSLGGAISGLAGSGGRSNIGGAAVNALSGLLGSRGAGMAGAAGALGSLVGGAGRGGSPVSALTSLFGGSSASGQLLSLLQRPETQRALAAMNLGPLGRSTIPLGAGKTPVPVSAFTNLIGQLSNQASAEAAALSGDGESALQYMTDQEGEFVGDPALDRDRAARVWELLNEAQAERVVNTVVRHYRESAEAASRAAMRQSAEYYQPDYYQPDHAEHAEDSEYYDAMDMADVYGLEMANQGENYFEYYGESSYFDNYGSERFQ
jgi:hypothetical protein